MGISEYNIGEAGTGALALWATWKYSADVVGKCKIYKGYLHTHAYIYINSVYILCDASIVVCKIALLM